MDCCCFCRVVLEFGLIPHPEGMAEPRSRRVKGTESGLSGLILRDAQLRCAPQDEERTHTAASIECGPVECQPNRVRMPVGYPQPANECQPHASVASRSVYWIASPLSPRRRR